MPYVTKYRLVNLLMKSAIQIKLPCLISVIPILHNCTEKTNLGSTSKLKNTLPSPLLLA